MSQGIGSGTERRAKNDGEDPLHPTRFNRYMRGAPPQPTTPRKMIVTRRCLGPGCSNTFKSPMTTDRQFCEKACRKRARGGKANRRAR